MAAKAGRAVLLKVRTVESPETFVTVGGARSHNVKKNDGIADVSDKDSGGYSEFEYGHGPQMMEVSHAGLYKGSVGEKFIQTHLESAAASRTLLRFQVIEPGRGTWEFDAVVERELVAPHDAPKEATYTIRSSGTITFTADSPQS